MPQLHLLGYARGLPAISPRPRLRSRSGSGDRRFSSAGNRMKNARDQERPHEQVDMETRFAERLERRNQ